jgi:hypothetical protein
VRCVPAAGSNAVGLASGRYDIRFTGKDADGNEAGDGYRVWLHEAQD